MNPQQHLSPRGSRPEAKKTFFAVLGLLVLTASCKIPTTFGQSSGVTTQAQHENHLFQGFFVAGIVVGVIVLILILWPVVFHRRKNDEIPTQTAEHIGLEVFYTIIPIIIVIVLFIATVITEDKVDAMTPNPQANITVVAYQWGWKFCYGSYDRTSNTCNNGPQVTTTNVTIGNVSTYPILRVPVGETIQITLISVDVIHGFYVRDLNFSRYAQPGHPNSFDLNFTNTGTFIGQCTQFCGLQHDLMYFQVQSMAQGAYTSWLSSAQSTGSSSSSSSSGGTVGTVGTGGTGGTGGTVGAPGPIGGSDQYTVGGSSGSTGGSSSISSTTNPSQG